MIQNMDLYGFPLEDYVNLKNGEGLEFFYKKNEQWNFGQVSMIKYGIVNIKYDGIVKHIYKSDHIDKRNGFEKFRLDVENFIQNGNFKWVNGKHKKMIKLLEMMPDFHGKFIQRHINGLKQVIETNETFNFIDEKNMLEISKFLNFLKN